MRNVAGTVGCPVSVAGRQVDTVETRTQRQRFSLPSPFYPYNKKTFMPHSTLIVQLNYL